MADTDPNLTGMGMTQPFVGAATHQTLSLPNTNVSVWHKAYVQPGAFEGTETAALPKFGAECRFTVAFQTQRQALLKVAV